MIAAVIYRIYFAVIMVYVF